MSESTGKARQNGGKAKLRPATTPEAREKQMIALAMNMAEEQLRNGTASSQVITHFLKLGTENARLEREKLEAENRLLRSKADQIDAEESSKEMYEAAMRSFGIYSGKRTDTDD